MSLGKRKTENTWNEEKYGTLKKMEECLKGQINYEICMLDIYGKIFIR